MRYLALASDYDGTLAHDGRVDARTVAALERLAASGRQCVLVTGRELPDLQAVFPQLDRFTRVVAENGALLYAPATYEETPLGEAPPEAFVAALKARGVAPLSVGRSIVATWTPHEQAVIETIRELGLELQVIFNKGAVMILPSGVNKESGLLAALAALGLSTHNVVAVGDAENDQSLLAASECAVAVANAIPTLKERADWVTAADHGAGVVELIEAILADDLASYAPARHDIPFGVRIGDARNGEEADGPGDATVRLPVYGSSLLVAGPSGSGKSTIVMGLLERIAAAGYQWCLVDPEGDYEGFPGAVTIGDPDQQPRVDEAMQLLSRPDQCVVVNLVGMALGERPPFFTELLPRLLELRARTGRPHWLVIDEAHHLFPAAWDPAPLMLPAELSELVLITVHPPMVSRAVLERVNHVAAVGAAPDETLAGFAQAIGAPAPAPTGTALQAGEALLWQRDRDEMPVHLRAIPARAEHRRHRRKYAEGHLPEGGEFVFTGPEGKLRLKAQNLSLFLQIADGVDDETWQYHLRRGDYARWFREQIKDPDLVSVAEAVQEDASLSAADSRAAIRKVVEERYTAPA